MVKISLVKLQFKYIDYYNKLVLGKNLHKFVLGRISGKNISIKLDKKKSSNTVTLRAPKHFKVGRHHYHTITKKYIITIYNFKVLSLVNTVAISNYLNTLSAIVEKKRIPKTLSLLTQARTTIKIVDTFNVV